MSEWKSEVISYPLPNKGVKKGINKHSYAIAVLHERKIELSKEQDKYGWGEIGWGDCEEHITKLESAIKRLKEE